MTATAITIGYKKLLVTCIVIPRPAIIKANSPIWVRQNPDCKAVFSGCPANTTPRVPNTDCPTKTVSVIITIGQIYWAIIPGSTIIPTETKNIAANKSFTGFTRRSIFSASIVSARIDPITKAPKAEEKPTAVANTTIRKHKPRETISKVSSPISKRVRLKKVGII